MLVRTERMKNHRDLTIIADISEQTELIEKIEQ